MNAFRIPTTLFALCLFGALTKTAWTEEAVKSGAEGVNKEFPIPRAEAMDPPAPEELEKSIQRGIDFLLKIQIKQGAWGSARQTRGLDVYAPVPGAHHGFRAGATALCLMALMESGDDRPEVQEAIDRGEAWWLKDGLHVRRADEDAMYNIWAHTYGLRALLQLQKRAGDEDGPHQEKIAEIKDAIDLQIDLLNRYESVNGGWGYYDFGAHTQKPASMPTSFTTATCLIALKEARDAGFEVDEKLFTRGKSVLNHQRKVDFSYLYSANHWWWPQYQINRPAGSLGRSQVCNLALRRLGQENVTEQVLIDWLDRLFARNLWLDIGRKRPIPHESHFAIAGYFYYYAHYYAALCMDELPPEKRPRFQAFMAHKLMSLQERDGDWWDFPLYDYHRQYGTAYAIMSLIRCRADRKVVGDAL
ncbi:MAG: hypothetical protein WBF93_06595 [Pirellulales bacterium]|nr:hypothetical protein [Pirellulales bacterium]